jgi:general secretion pathway protein G
VSRWAELAGRARRVLRRGASVAASRGVTLVELVAVSAILVVLAGITLPVANTMVKRQKELELRRALREIREALDRFQFDVQRYPGIRTEYLNVSNEEGYPEELKWLVEGVDTGASAAEERIKYLRRLPVDPMTGKAEWGTRSSRDRPDSLFSDGINIFDVYSKSDKVGLNGVPYSKW